MWPQTLHEPATKPTVTSNDNNLYSNAIRFIEVFSRKPMAYSLTLKEEVILETTCIWSGVNKEINKCTNIILTNWPVCQFKFKNISLYVR